MGLSLLPSFITENLSRTVSLQSQSDQAEDNESKAPHVALPEARVLLTEVSCESSVYLRHGGRESGLLPRDSALQGLYSSCTGHIGIMYVLYRKLARSRYQG